MEIHVDELEQWNYEAEMKFDDFGDDDCESAIGSSIATSYKTAMATIGDFTEVRVNDYMTCINCEECLNVISLMHLFMFAECMQFGLCVIMIMSLQCCMTVYWLFAYIVYQQHAIIMYLEHCMPTASHT